MPGTERTIGLSERSWALRYQQFLGTFFRAGDLWFAKGSSPQFVERLLSVYSTTPGTLRQLARQYELTVSLSTGATTAEGHASCVYGHWHSTTARFSPHLEVGGSSLQDDVTLRAHLTHELSHLLYWSLPLPDRLRFARFLFERTGATDAEVTHYVQRKLDEHYAGQCWFEGPGRRCPWAQEAFPDSIATFWVPKHPDRQPNSNVDVLARVEYIERLSGRSLTA